MKERDKKYFSQKTIRKKIYNICMYIDLIFLSFNFIILH